MKRKEPLPCAQWASIHWTERFISVEPLSGYSIIQREDEGCIIYLPPDVSDEALGQALLEALGKSRFIYPPDREFSNPERYMRCYRNWQKDFMRRYGYKTKRDAYRNMNWCEAERCEGTISIQPHRRDDKPEHWIWLPPDQNVVIPVTENAAAIGAAMRLALDRCG
jgi:hypothetical protein